MLKFKAEIEAATFEEFREKVAQLAMSVGIGAEEPKSEPKSKSKKKETPQEEVKAEAPKEIKEPKKYTKEIVGSLLKKVNDELGLQKAREILSSVGKGKLSELGDEHFETVGQACEAALSH